MSNFDVIVVGSGPGGYVAAIRAAQLGLKTAVVEKEHLGGICLNWGCIPTKALLRSAEILHHAKHAANYGVKVEKVSFDINEMVKRSRGVAKQLSSGVAGLLKKNKVEVIEGEAKLLGKSKLEVTLNKDGKKSVFEAKHIILATGARARVLEGMEPDGKLVWTYREALVADCVPTKMLVVGSGAIGIEFASFFNTLGSKVEVVEYLDNILAHEDAEISQLAHKSFEKQGMKISTATKVVSLKKSANNVTAVLEDKKGNKREEIFDKVIVAAGIVANLENLGLENTKIKTENGKIVTNDFSETNEKGIYAIGDISNGPALAHKASHEGIICVEKIAGKNPHKMDLGLIPGCIYASPQVASIGLTEKKALEMGKKIKVGRFPFLANGKAIALGEPEGLVKTIFDETTGELLGAHMIGAEVTEMLQGYVIAMNLETTEQELMHTVFAHPTLSEMMHESVLNAFGRTIHF